MADAPLLYKKLPGRGSSAIARTTLWQGPDHLLVVTSWPSGEGYRRFFFRDIQAIVIRRTARRMWINIVLLVFALVSFALAIAFSERALGALLFAGIISGFWFWVIFILVNSLMGQACETYIQTAIQTERITSLGRLPTVEKVLGRIQLRIVEAQAASVDAPSRTA